MTSHYTSRWARKAPTPNAARYPTAAEVADILGGKTQAGGYMCRVPAPCIATAIGNPRSASRMGAMVGRCSIALLAARTTRSSPRLGRRACPRGRDGSELGRQAVF